MQLELANWVWLNSVCVWQQNNDKSVLDSRQSPTWAYDLMLDFKILHCSLYNTDSITAIRYIESYIFNETIPKSYLCLQVPGISLSRKATKTLPPYFVCI